MIDPKLNTKSVRDSLRVILTAIYRTDAGRYYQDISMLHQLTELFSEDRPYDLTKFFMDLPDEIVDQFSDLLDREGRRIIVWENPSEFISSIYSPNFYVKVKEASMGDNKEKEKIVMAIVAELANLLPADLSDRERIPIYIKIINPIILYGIGYSRYLLLNYVLDRGRNLFDTLITLFSIEDLQLILSAIRNGKWKPYYTIQT